MNGKASAGFRASRPLFASAARDWIENETPQLLQPPAQKTLECWEQTQQASPQALWLPILRMLRQARTLDAEYDFCALYLGLAPNDGPFRLRLAEIAFLRGDSREAEELLSSFPQSHPLWRSACLLRLKTGLLPLTNGQLESLSLGLLDDGDWGADHADLVRALCAERRGDHAKKFLAQWIERWSLRPDKAFEIALLLFECGDHKGARSIFQPIWGISHMIGTFDGHIPAYGPQQASSIKEKISKARSAEHSVPHCRLSDVPLPALMPSIMLVTFDQLDFPNDLAFHFQQSAKAAGIELDLYADTALCHAHELKCSDLHVSERIEVFAQALRDRRPQIVILDCCFPLTLRGLNPEIMFRLRRELGFKLVIMLRDAHSDAILNPQAWAPACDSIFSFDPASPLFDLDIPHVKEKALFLPVPVLHSAMMVQQPKTHDLLFLGATNFALRKMLLSVLMTEDFPFTGIIGADRKRLAPDMPSYAGLLASSRAVLNVSAHSRSDKLITGRVWEAAGARALLIEQEYQGTAQLFVPYRHYLPWSNLTEIIHYGFFIRDNPELIQEMACDAHHWALSHFGPQRLWAHLLNHALRPDNKPGDADFELAQAWHLVTFGAE